MLNKALYGLHESPRDWYECLDRYLNSLGFVRNEFDYCLYTLRERDEIIYLIIFVDNSGAVSIVKYDNFTKRSKYIEVHYHFVNENYEKGLIDVIKVNSERNVADILTKALGRVY